MQYLAGIQIARERRLEQKQQEVDSGAEEEEDEDDQQEVGSHSSCKIMSNKTHKMVGVCRRSKQQLITRRSVLRKRKHPSGQMRTKKMRSSSLKMSTETVVLLPPSKKHVLL